MAWILLKKQPFYVHKKLSKIPTSSMRELKIGILFSWTKGKKRKAFRHFDIGYYCIKYLVV